MVDPVDRFNSIVQKIKDNDQRLTPQRLTIVKILAHSEGHPSVEKIYQQLHDDFPTMSLSTVYKTVSDDFGQPRALFNLFDDGQKARLFTNIAEAMQGVPDETAERQLGHFEKVHPDYAAGVRKALADLA